MMSPQISMVDHRQEIHTSLGEIKSGRRLNLTKMSQISREMTELMLFLPKIRIDKQRNRECDKLLQHPRNKC